MQFFLCYLVFFLAATDFPETLFMGLSLIDMHSVAASIWAVIMFSYSSFWVYLSDVSWRVSNFFLAVIVYWLIISLFVSEAHSCCVTLNVCLLFPCRLGWIFAETIGRYSFKWEVCLTVQSAIYLLLVYEYILFTNPSARAGYDTRSIFKRSLTGLNSEFSFSLTSCLTNAEEPSLSYYLPIAGRRIIGFIPFARVLVLCEMQSVSSRIWTRVVVFIS